MDTEKIFLKKLGLGLAAIGRPGYINLGHHDDLPDKTMEGMEKQAHLLLDKAWSLGVRYFDMARSYGKAEAFMNSWLQKNPEKASKIRAASKWGYVYTADWKVDAEHHEIKYHTLENYRNQIEESRQLLGSNLNIYQIHSATLESGVLENVEVLKSMSRLKHEGINVGLSLSGANQTQVLETAMKVEIDKVPLFDVVQVTYNILEQSLTPGLKNLGDDVIVVVKEAMANGRLASYQHQYLDHERARVLSKLTKKLEVTPDQLALAFVLNQSFVDIVLSGASDATHLESNIGASKIKLDSSVMTALELLSESPKDYWETRSSLDWT